MEQTHLQEGGKKIIKYVVEPKWTSSQTSRKLNTYVQRSQIDTILTHNADVYVRDPQGKETLLLRFRKKVLSPVHLKEFYDNVIDFAHNTTQNRGNATGNNGTRGVKYNKSVKSNILGFFDRWSPSQKYKFRENGIHPEIDIRPCRFNVEHPDQYHHLLPLLKEIDQWYARLVPEQYAHQIRKARNIPQFHIEGTAFTTVTTNINYRTSIHTDKGDDEEGFGNLVVLERGEYEGGETCFPQYGLAVDVREGDVLFMDVHQPHGNLPMKTLKPATNTEKEAIRLSVVCYLRKKIWEKTRGKTRKQLRGWHRTFMDFSRKTVSSIHPTSPPRHLKTARKEYTKSQKGGTWSLWGN